MAPTGGVFAATAPADVTGAHPSLRPAANLSSSPAYPPPLPADLADADLVLLLASHAGIPVSRTPFLAPPPDATVGSLVLKLAHRSGASHATPADVAAFDDLHPAVAAPVVTLLAAMDQAWDLRDRAVADIPEPDRRALARLALDGRPDDPRASQLAAPLDRAALLDAAILLLDTAESVALPQLQEAARLGVWPADPLADPLGILRIGGTGDDTETLDRLLQIDARGNDTYRNNAGGTTMLADLNPTTPDYPVAMSLDFEGNDVYMAATNPSQGGAILGLGWIWDLSGNDRYQCPYLCLGAGADGIGIARDGSGHDERVGGEASIGYATLLGILRDDGGTDSYVVGPYSGGVAFGALGLGTLWDRQGADEYAGLSALWRNRMGWAFDGGHGYFVDEGPDMDEYSGAPDAHGCNNCTWRRGEGFTSRGLGNDNSGGLSYVLLHQRWE